MTDETLDTLVEGLRLATDCYNAIAVRRTQIGLERELLNKAEKALVLEENQRREVMNTARVKLLEHICPVVEKSHYGL